MTSRSRSCLDVFRRTRPAPASCAALSAVTSDVSPDESTKVTALDVEDHGGHAGLERAHEQGAERLLGLEVELAFQREDDRTRFVDVFVHDQ